MYVLASPYEAFACQRFCVINGSVLPKHRRNGRTTRKEEHAASLLIVFTYVDVSKEEEDEEDS